MNYFKSSFILLLLLSSVVTSFAQDNIFTSKQNVALNGYDVVAYFNQNDAVRGNNEHTVTLDDVIYYFSSAKNATAFKEKPSAYQPVYGGYCAFAMAMKGAKVPSDPKTFKIRDGKLYLFFNDFYEGKPFNTIIPWNQNEVGMLGKANANWKKSK